jgi:microcystin degradation protein MlrC
VRVWIGDPAEAQYVQTTPAHLMEVAARLVAAEGLLRIDGEWAEATPGLMGQRERFENARRQAVEELEKKHAFERG